MLMAAVLALVAMAGLAAMPAQAQTGQQICDHPDIGCCGELSLVLLNPDLQPRDDGFIDASGNFFVQFQAIGEEADRIETFGFSFGEYTTEFPEDVCDLPPQLWVTGQQLVNYRADTDPSDGFFINLQTALVPDGQYTAAVHAYDGDDNELARFWASAIVENCDTAVDPAGQAERCDGDEEQTTRNDGTEPWPIVLPGDGLTAADVDGFTLEFAEPLANLTVYLNSDDITAELQEWEGREWDNDLIPGYGPHGLGAILVPECSQQPPQECGHLGEAYQWTTRQLTDADVLRVEAEDRNGNLAVKNLHIGSSVTSGGVTAEVPILSWTADTTRATVAPGETAVFTFEIQNKGGATGHPFASAEGPAGWTLAWQPDHQQVASGEKEVQELHVTAPANATGGAAAINATMEYTQSGEPKFLHERLSVEVAGAEVGGNETVETDGSQESLGPGVAVLLLGALAVAARRRRRT